MASYNKASRLTVVLALGGFAILIAGVFARSRLSIGFGNLMLGMMMLSMSYEMLQAGEIINNGRCVRRDRNPRRFWIEMTILLGIAVLWLAMAVGIMRGGMPLSNISP